MKKALKVKKGQCIIETKVKLGQNPIYFELFFLSDIGQN